MICVGALSACGHAHAHMYTQMHTQLDTQTCTCRHVRKLVQGSLNTAGGLTGFPILYVEEKNRVCYCMCEHVVCLQAMAGCPKPS